MDSSYGLTESTSLRLAAPKVKTSGTALLRGLGESAFLVSDSDARQTAHGTVTQQPQCHGTLQGGAEAESRCGTQGQAATGSAAAVEAANPDS